MNSNKSNGQLTAQINVSEHKKSGFDLSNDNYGTGQIGRIIPTRALHVMPNDTIKQDSKVAVQFEPLAVPILANMDVKQEHFYVTYNSIWQNWDKFISGGEKMDYQGVVPNVTLKHIFRIIEETFFHDPQTEDEYVYLNLFRIPTAVNTDPTDICFTKKIMDFNAAIEHLDVIGDKYYIKDLLKPQYEAINNIITALEKFVPNEDNNYIAWKILKYDNTTQPTDQKSLEMYVAEQLREYCNDNVYARPLVEVIAKSMSSSNYNVAIPTNEFMELVTHMYDFIRSFVGVSSNIDYLNMNRLTPTDLLYMYFIEVSTKFIRNIQDGTYSSTDSINLNILPSASHLTEMPMSILNLRANYLIWFNNYRDILLEADAYEPQNMDTITQDELFVLLVPRQRCWEKDAFTTALDNPGTGNVGVPVGTQELTFDPYSYKNLLVNKDIQQSGADIANYDASSMYEVSIGNQSWKLPTSYLTGINPKDDTEVGITSGFSLYQLDAAQRAQKWLQKALFYGNRISDFYYMHFGVRYLDARLRLPELLASSSQLVKIDTIMNNTTIASEGTIAGDRAGFASAYDNGNSFDRFCEEHGVIMSYLTIMPQVTYAYGTNRDYSRLDQFDFAFSEFATLGMDAVYDSEITNATMDIPNYDTVQVFGYQGKYYDYKAKHSEEHGELLTTQDMYTFGRKFNMYGENGRPKLNYEFIHCFPDLDMFVVDSSLADYFRYDIRHSTAAERLLPSQSLYI